ncbi:fluoride efflux transporter CrcB [Streptomyces sp. NRRL WC-3549]|uniref:fluoride efflux transporter CrcB n=1 Tax=Streptomyces sp. NRRL WC-3549 TaxID=1463925 RepID=UPI00068C4CB5|nr:fluoride efflux transporter CrcB [Streptomyces sp. NRRL WC-3549]
MRPEESGPFAAAVPADPDVDLSVPPRRRGPGRAPYAVPGVIAVGGALGALARFAAARLWPTAPGTFPWTTLCVNAAGCLVIGVLLVAVTETGRAHRLLRPFFGTGVLGGFTTFSTYTVDVERLIADGRVATALIYLASTLVAALAAVSTGTWTARRFLVKWSRR